MMNTNVSNNYSKVKLSLLYVPIAVIVVVVTFLIWKNALSAEGYVNCQKEFWLFLNTELSQMPDLQYNLTQLGDAFIALSLLSIFILYAPKIWEALLSASLLSLLFSKGLKEFFDIPRPVTIFGEAKVNIVGETLVGYSSFPSGHSITIFTTLTVLMYAFVPSLHKNRWLRIAYFLPILLIGIFIAFSRVGVGAHHPIDVLMGSTIGYISGILGIYIAQKYRIWAWISNKKAYPFFILLFLGCSLFLIRKMAKENLIIFYLPLTSLLISLYLITKAYVKEFKQVRK